MNLIVICLDTFRADIVGPNQKLSFIKTPNRGRDESAHARTFSGAEGHTEVSSG